MRSAVGGEKNEIAGTALWTAVQGYKKKKEGNGAQSSNKEFTPLPDTNALSGAFLGRFVLKNRQFLPNTFIKLPERLWCKEDEVDFIFVRDCYTGCACRVLKEFREGPQGIGPADQADGSAVATQGGRKNVVVAGNKGIGKSVFGIILAVEAIREGLIVVYETAKDMVWIIGNSTQKLSYEDVEAVGKSWKIQVPVQAGV
jgi:hypothetical protein